MAEAARAFEDNRRPPFLESIPSPPPDVAPDDGPWVELHANAMPPMMLDIRLKSGRIVSHPYSSVDFIDYRDAGHVQVGIVGARPSLVTIEGRNLSKLRALLALGRIRSINECDDREYDRADADPSIDKITIEKLARE
ncbi:MAG: hypothetical protein AAGG44_13325 [Planctomycetota bacterium]